MIYLTFYYIKIIMVFLINILLIALSLRSTDASPYQTPLLVEFLSLKPNLNSVVINSCYLKAVFEVIRCENRTLVKGYGHDIRDIIEEVPLDKSACFQMVRSRSYTLWGSHTITDIRINSIDIRQTTLVGKILTNGECTGGHTVLLREKVTRSYLDVVIIGMIHLEVHSKLITRDIFSTHITIDHTLECMVYTGHCYDNRNRIYVWDIPYVDPCSASNYNIDNKLVTMYHHTTQVRQFTYEDTNKNQIVFDIGHIYTSCRDYIFISKNEKSLAKVKQENFITVNTESTIGPPT